MVNKQEEILLEAERFVQKELAADSSGHDWWHIYRVTKTAKKIAKAEHADDFICELAALLHDIADEKLNVTKEAGLKKVTNWLEEHHIEKHQLEHIMEIISTMSYNGGNNEPMKTLEGQIVQDADRLDAIGAVGIARTFAYAGWKGHAIYDPTIPSRNQMTAEEYRNQKSTSINHFYEKLLKLKDLMNTNDGKRLAEERHVFMEEYLKQFYKEWGEDK